jgi:hypothetical protein
MAKYTVDEIIKRYKHRLDNNSMLFKYKGNNKVLAFQNTFLTAERTGTKKYSILHETPKFLIEKISTQGQISGSGAANYKLDPMFMIKKDGWLYSCGYNIVGELGLGPERNEYYVNGSSTLYNKVKFPTAFELTKIPGMNNVKQIIKPACAPYYIAVKFDGTVWRTCVEGDNYNNLRNIHHLGTITKNLVPGRFFQLNSLKNVKEVIYFGKSFGPDTTAIGASEDAYAFLTYDNKILFNIYHNKWNFYPYYGKAKLDAMYNDLTITDAEITIDNPYINLWNKNKAVKEVKFFYFSPFGPNIYILTKEGEVYLSASTKVDNSGNFVSPSTSYYIPNFGIKVEDPAPENIPIYNQFIIAYEYLTTIYSQAYAHYCFTLFYVNGWQKVSLDRKVFSFFPSYMSTIYIDYVGNIYLAGVVNQYFAPSLVEINTMNDVPVTYRIGNNIDLHLTSYPIQLNITHFNGLDVTDVFLQYSYIVFFSMGDLKQITRNNVYLIGKFSNLSTNYSAATDYTIKVLHSNQQVRHLIRPNIMNPYAGYALTSNLAEFGGTEYKYPFYEFVAAHPTLEESDYMDRFNYNLFFMINSGLYMINISTYMLYFRYYTNTIYYLGDMNNTAIGNNSTYSVQALNESNTKNIFYSHTFYGSTPFLNILSGALKYLFLVSYLLTSDGTLKLSENDPALSGIHMFTYGTPPSDKTHFSFNEIFNGQTNHSGGAGSGVNSHVFRTIADMKTALNLTIDTKTDNKKFNHIVPYFFDTFNTTNDDFNKYLYVTDDENVLSSSPGKYLEDLLNGNNTEWFDNFKSKQFIHSIISDYKVLTNYSYVFSYKHDIVEKWDPYNGNSFDAVYYKNTSGQWVDYLKIVALNPTVADPRTVANSTSLNVNFLLKDLHVIPKCDYVDASGYVYHINEGDGSQLTLYQHFADTKYVDTSNPTEVNLSFVDLHTLTSGQLPIQHRDDLRITLLESGETFEDKLIWLNGAFVPYIQDTVNLKVAYIEKAAALIPVVEKCKKYNTAVSLATDGTGTVEEPVKISELRYDVKLMLFSWNNIKISQFILPTSVETSLLAWDHKGISVPDMIQFDYPLVKDTFLLFLNGKILSEDSYNIDTFDKRRIKLLYYRDSIFKLLNQSIDFTSNYFDRIKDKVSHDIFSIVQFSHKLDTKTISIVRDRTCIANCPYIGEVLFKDVDYGDLITLDGYYIPYEFVENPVIRYPLNKYDLRTSTIDDPLALADIVRYKVLEKTIL